MKWTEWIAMDKREKALLLLLPISSIPFPLQKKQLPLNTGGKELGMNKCPAPCNPLGVMSQKLKKKLCWNCDGSAALEVENCPYCGVYLSPLGAGGEEKEGIFAPP